MSLKDELLNFKNDDGLIVVEEAESWARNNPDSDLHRSLEWDDAKAGHQHRLWQLRRLIAIHIVSEEGVRQVVSLSIDRKSQGGGYRELGDVLRKPSLRDVMLRDALAELERVQAKYNTLQELAEVWAAKDNVRRRRRDQPQRPAAVAATG